MNTAFGRIVIGRAAGVNARKGWRRHSESDRIASTSDDTTNVQHSTSNFQIAEARRMPVAESEAKASARYDMQERLLTWTADVVKVAESIPTTRAGTHIAGQIVRSATSPLANHAEAQSAESRRDFIHKMRISLKELRETRTWLLLVQRMGLAKDRKALEPLLQESDELIAIFVSSVRTARKNLSGSRPQDRT
jgi:four helix bundle protein